MVNLTIDVVIAAFNAQPFVQETLDSIAAQTAPPKRIIFVDDGSTDKTAEIVRRWAQASHIDVLLLPQDNQGLAAARNRALQESDADLIALIDADDLSLPGTLEALARPFAERDNLALCFGDAEIFDAQGVVKTSSLADKRINEAPYSTRPDTLRVLERPLYEYLVNGSFIPVSAAMFSRKHAKAVGYFDPRLTRSEDLDFFMRLSRTGSVAYYPAIMSRKRQHAHNLTAPRHSIQLNMQRIQVLAKMLAHADSLELTHAERRATVRGMKNPARSLLYAGSKVGFTSYLDALPYLWSNHIVFPILNVKHLGRAVVTSFALLAQNVTRLLKACYRAHKIKAG